MYNATRTRHSLGACATTPAPVTVVGRVPPADLYDIVLPAEHTGYLAMPADEDRSSHGAARPDEPAEAG